MLKKSLDLVKQLSSLGDDCVDEYLTTLALSNKSLSALLIDKQQLSEELYLKTIAKELGSSYQPIDESLIDPSVCNTIPEHIARSHSIVALFKLGKRLYVAISNSETLTIIEELESLNNCLISVVFAPKKSIDAQVAISYSYDEMQFKQEKRKKSLLFDLGIQLHEGKPLSQKEQCKKLLKDILSSALKKKAKDIHIENNDGHCIVKFRINGMLNDELRVPEAIKSTFFNTAKELASIPLESTELIEQGKLPFEHKRKNSYFSLSVLSDKHGEKLLITQKRHNKNSKSLSQLGLSKDHYETISRLLRMGSGLILVCGPEQSGKKNTLYTLLKEVNKSESHIITLEKTIKESIDNVQQLSLESKSGSDYTKAFDSICKEDPDVIMISDLTVLDSQHKLIETATSGVLVLSAMKSDSAQTCISYLLDNGIQARSICNSVAGIITQRLLKTICPNCKEKVAYSHYKAKKYDALISELKTFHKQPDLYIGKGCDYCKQSGYKGKSAIFELVTINKQLESQLTKTSSAKDFRKLAIQEGMSSLLDDAIEKLKQGITSLDEVTDSLEYEIIH